MKIKISVAVACFLPGWVKDLSAPLYDTCEQNFTTKRRTAMVGLPGL
jgi:hypothetical protein